MGFVTITYDICIKCKKYVKDVYDEKFNKLPKSCECGCEEFEKKGEVVHTSAFKPLEGYNNFKSDIIYPED